MFTMANNYTRNSNPTTSGSAGQSHPISAIRARFTIPGHRETVNAAYVLSKEGLKVCLVTAKDAKSEMRLGDAVNALFVPKNGHSGRPLTTYDQPGLGEVATGILLEEFGRNPHKFDAYVEDCRSLVDNFEITTKVRR